MVWSLCSALHSLGRRVRGDTRPRVASYAVFTRVLHAAHEVHSRLAMSTSKAGWRGRVIGIGVTAIAASQITGCVTRSPIAPSAVSTSRGTNLELVLSDQTRVSLDNAVSSDNSLCGVVQHCVGPSCVHVRVDECVDKKDVVTLKERKVNGTGIAVGVVAGVALTVGAIMLATSSSRPSGGSTGGSSGGSSGGSWTLSRRGTR